MPATHVVLNLLGEIALLLWGIRMVHSGITRAFGAELRRAVAVGLKTRGRAFVSGAAITMALQSSTATGLMATSLMGDGALALAPALALMLGANVGSALIVQVFSFDISLIYPVFIFGGYIAFRRGQQTRLKDLGRMAIGFGLMILALSLLSETMRPIAGAQAVRDVLASLTREPLVNLAIAAVLTWLAHSSVAVVLLVVSLAGAGIVAPEAALAMVLGANLGSAFNPLVESAGADRVKVRLAVGNLANRALGCALFLPLHGFCEAALRARGVPVGLEITIFHLIFNLAMAALFIGFLTPLADALARAFPQAVDLADPATPKYLAPGALDMPAVALSNAARESLRMSDTLEAMLRGSQDVLRSGDRKRADEVRAMDNVVDRLHAQIERYLSAIDGDSLNEEDGRRLSEVLAFAINVEHAGDVIEKSLMKLAQKLIKTRASLSAEALGEIDAMFEHLVADLQLACTVFTGGNLEAARKLAAEKEFFREVERKATEQHFARVRGGLGENYQSGGVQLDIVRDLKRIAGHIVATAYPLLEQSEMLRRSRLA